MNSQFLFLGTGGSNGIPMIGCNCKVCLSQESKNQRLRSSGLLLMEGKKILIDVGPDFRTQALKHGVHDIDGVCLTHPHYDHIGGLDDLRVYYLLHNKTIPVLASEGSLSDLKCRCYYFFQEKSLEKSLQAQFDFHLLPEERGVLDFVGLSIQYLTYEQAGTKVTGYRFGSFAYISDINTYPHTIFEDLMGLETLVVSAVRHRSSNMHFTVHEAISFAKKVGAKKTFFTHITHEIDHQATNDGLPDGMQMAYDGLRIEL